MNSGQWLQSKFWPFSHIVFLEKASDLILELFEWSIILKHDISIDLEAAPMRGITIPLLKDFERKQEIEMDVRILRHIFNDSSDG